MDTPKIFESEYRFCLILWEHEPIKSGELVALCKEQLGWKNSTTYTVIKRLAQRGVLKNENTIVTSLVSKDQVHAAEIDELVETKFEGSLPAFVAAFTRHQKMTQKEIDQKVVEVVKTQHEKAKKILEDNRDKLDELAGFLYEKETITGEEFMEILTGGEKQ